MVVAVACALGVVPASGAELPAQWCGIDEVRQDRPDVVAGEQVHVVYMVAAEQPDRFFDYAPLIARELAAIDEWWRTQDPTRSPRFDFAVFPGCPTEFGGLDLSSVTLPPGVDTTVPARQEPVETALQSLGSTNASMKKYLVFLDGAGPDRLCGRSAGAGLEANFPYRPAMVYLLSGPSCGMDRLGTASGLPTTIAAHELIHLLNNTGGESWPAPNACPDKVHVCDSGVDILAPGEVGTTTRIDQRVLDVNHDDYYAHAGPWWDVQDSKWLMHLDEPHGTLHVAVESDAPDIGTVLATPGPTCTNVCDWRHDGSVPLQLHALAGESSRFGGWRGACAGQGAYCSITVDGPVTVQAIFESSFLLNVTFGRGGVVAAPTFDECAASCTMSLSAACPVILAAKPRRGYEFVRWRGACTGTKPRCKLDAHGDTGDQNTSAVFHRS